MEKIFLTGANGFLGNNLARELLARGYAVRCLVLEGTDTEILSGLDVDLVTGNLLKPETFREHVNGCDFVIHCASITTVNPSRVPMARPVNVDGTRNMLEAAHQAGVKRFIHVGTANSFGSGSKAEPGDETKPYNSAHFRVDYMDTKLEAQRLVLEYHRQTGMPVIVVNPTFMIGPNDPGPTSNLMVLNVAQGNVPAYPGGGRNYACVKDNCVAIANALTMGRPGECYILGNRNMDYKEAFGLMARTIGVKPPGIRMPGFIFVIFGAVCSGLSALFPRLNLQINLAMARIGNVGQYYSPAKAVRELGLPQSSVEQAILESYQSLKDHGQLKEQ